MTRRVVITGVGALTPLGHDWPSVRARVLDGRNAVVRMDGWDDFEGLHTRLGAPVVPYDLPAHYDRKATRSMGRVAVMATRATELALAQAGLLGDPLVRSGRLGIAYGSSAGSPDAIAEFGAVTSGRTLQGLTATTYIRMMSHTAAVNLGIFFGVTGRMITTSSACTSASQAIGYAYETIRSGKQVAMIAGGADELHAVDAAVFDIIFATSTRNDAPHLTPRPFDVDRDGMVLGEGAATLVLEDLDHARARGAPILGEVVGFGTNSDGRHVTHPSAPTMAEAMRLALADAGLDAAAIGYLNAHGTGTEHGDLAEATATHEVYGSGVPISSFKSFTGHTIAACGAVEAWMSLEMLREGWVAPTINLDTVDPRCPELDHVVGAPRRLDVELVATQNFAFGGINTSLILRRWA